MTGRSCASGATSTCKPGSGTTTPAARCLRTALWPRDLGIERLEEIEVRWGEEWVPLRKSISAANYATFDSDRDERSWPVEAWQIFEDEMIEVWPIPSDNADTTSLEGRMRLTGIRDLNDLVADSDRADLDDVLIVKWAAVRPLARSGSKDAQIVLDEAKQIELDLTANFSKIKSFSLGGCPPEKGRQPRGPARVHYRTNEPGA